jgi:hypothetical protein
MGRQMPSAWRHPNLPDLLLRAKYRLFETDWALGIVVAAGGLARRRSGGTC